MPDFDVITFGETMIRLSPPGRERLESAATLEFRTGGTESNTAIALAQLGRRAAWWSRLPDDPLGRRIAADIRRWGVDTSLVLWTAGERAGVYYIESGAPPRPSQVHYDRANSAISNLHAADVDWSHLSRARHLHLTGITPALSASCAGVVEKAAAEARARGLTVSFDINYRAKLWSPDNARTVLSSLISGIDLLFCPVGDAEQVFGFTGSAQRVAATFRDSFGIASIVITAGSEGATALITAGTIEVPAVAATEVDRIGAGDAFDAGVLDGFLDGDVERGLRFGTAMAALKNTIPGDQLIATRAEIEACAAGGAAGVVR